MCGIVGLLNLDPTEKVERSLLERMCTAIRHRGPDDTGIWIGETVGLGMTRLSIIDLSTGQQPIHNEDRTVWIVFNGEIYNYREERDILLHRGHRFYTTSDTEVIVHLYEEYGEDCVHRLRGMFAFAIWDQRCSQLLLARDRLGIKPLYYYSNGSRLLFGSELKTILQCRDVHREVYPPALVNYFFYGYVPDPDTMYTGIKKLPPGHILVHRDGQPHLRQYWDIQFEVERSQPEAYYVERTLAILDDAVRSHLVSDVPLGAFLSGGVDSGIVVALMARHMSKPVKTFSIGFTNQAFNELPYARMVARQYGTDHHEEIVNPDAESIILDLVRQFDEPFADSSAIPTYYVSRMARRHVTVALSGDGGDEVFAGYTHYRLGPVTKYSQRIPESLRTTLLRPLSNSLPAWLPGAQTLAYISCSDIDRIIMKYSRGLSTHHASIFSPELVHTVESTDPSVVLLNLLRDVQDRDRLTQLQYLDSKTYLCGDILTKLDRASMMVSLEARVPFLDHPLVEFAASLPPHLKMKGNATKYLLKRVAERLLPHKAIHRPKQGFAVPIESWVRHEWSEMCHELVLGHRALARRNFNPGFLNRIMTEHRCGRRDHSATIWTLMVLELWFRNMIDDN